MDKTIIDQHELDRRIRLDRLKSGISQSLVLLITTPLWAILISVALSGQFPVLGTIGLINLFAWVGLVFGACVMALAAGYFANRNLHKDPFANLSRQENVTYAATALINGAWAMCFWMLWQDGNAANHLFLTVLILSAITNAILGKSSDFKAFLASVIPIVTLAEAKWITGQSDLSPLFAILTPLWLLTMAVQVRTIAKDAYEAARARFENEALAAALVHARDEAEHSRRYAEHANATKTAFLANMSHELRTPLNAILGFSEIINTEALGPSAREKYKDYAGDILTSGKHLLSLINDLLDIAKIEAGKLEVTPQWIEAARLVRECLHLMESRAAERKIRLSWAVASDAPRIFADERAIRQILFNLVSNAVKFTPAEGRIEVQVRRVGEDVVITVEDTGCGIPKTQIDRVFLPFEQIDNRYGATAGGTGLGLTLVKVLTELHGGTVALESEEGHGTQVSARFPLPKAPALVEPTPLATPVAASAHARTITG